jgi:hypothetical protein
VQPPAEDEQSPGAPGQPGEKTTHAGTMLLFRGLLASPGAGSFPKAQQTTRPTQTEGRSSEGT